MRKKIALSLFVAVAAVVPAARAVAQLTDNQEVKPVYVRLHIGMTGHIYCYGDGSDCKVG
ncbi:MAG TPA: hypothetical protein VF705_09590 [Longimicrobium sp.]|jgi:hypothetical protein